MALCNDTELHSRMYRLRSHGITRSYEEMKHAPHGLWYYEQIDLGFNYRMTDIEAALGLSQLKKLDTFIDERHKIAQSYVPVLKPLSMTCQQQPTDRRSSYHLFVIRVPREMKPELSRNACFERLRASGIGVGLHYIPVYRQPYYERMGFLPKDFPESEAYYAEAMSLPIYPGFSQEELNQVVETLTRPIGHQTLF